ncbi:peroxisome assembly factor 2-like [Gigantopelta aegis]|uniref:peroxisome assembly factor 2-like n=1 Tax=Gigantopelta aegis TaxID=1735272 RepID=UPI001B88927E|nr:peroxisome assembly factor 2-like [Gigantopelta aegis]
MAALTRKYKSHRVNFYVTELDTQSHPLHLFVSVQNAIEFNYGSAGDSFCILLRAKRVKNNNYSFPGSSPRLADLDSPQSSLSLHDICYDNVCTNFDVQFVCQVWIKDHVVWTLPSPDQLSDSPKQKDQPLKLACSNEFLQHYDIDQDDFIYCQYIQIFPLKRVVFAVSNLEAYLWLQQNKFSNGMLVEVCEQHKALVRKDDVLLVSYPSMFLDDDKFHRSWYFSMRAVECSPLQQGAITINTEVVLFYDEYTRMSFVEKRKRLSTTTIEHMLSKSEGLLMSDFCRSISQSSTHNESGDGSKEGSVSSIGIIQSSEMSFVIGSYVVEQDSKWKSILGRELERSSDPHNFIGISKKLMIELGLFDGSPLKVSIVEDDVKKDGMVGSGESQPVRKPIHKMVMVKCLSRHLSGADKVFISALLWFTLQGMPPLKRDPTLLCEKMSNMHVESDVDEGSQSLSASWSASIPTAKEVHISIVNSPNYSPKMNYSEALKKYFQVARVVSVGDVFAIKSSDDPQFWQSADMDTGLRFPVMFFQVIQVEPSTPEIIACIVDSNNTRVLQVGSVHSFVPQIAYQYFTDHASNYWLRLNCPGMNNYIDKLESVVLPHLIQSPANSRLQELPPSILISGPVGCGKATVVEAVARRLCMNIQQVNCHHICGESAGSTEARIQNVFLAASIYSPCILLLRNIHVIGKDRDGNTEDPRVISNFHSIIMNLTFELRDFPLVVIATTHKPTAVSQDLNEAFLHEIKMEVPCESERIEIIHGLVEFETTSADLSLPHIAQRTAGFVLGDLVALVAHAKRQSFSKALKLCSVDSRPSPEDEEDLVAAGLVLEQTDFEYALDKLQSAHSDTIGAPKIPSVKWDDIGGLYSVKSDILDTIQLPLQHPELLQAGLRRSGVLLYGPPGTGKTLLAKAVATECSLNFLSCFSVFKRARNATPCVIFFDELDSLAPNRGRSGDSGGVMDRVVSQLLAELDGLHKSCDVFVIGATNRPDLLDPALLRPGRFDKLLFLGVSEDRPSQLNILEALTRKFVFQSSFSLMSVVEKCPWNMTGADFYALSSDALLNAVKKKIALLEAGKDVDQTRVEVSEKDFLDALNTLVPSVSETELSRYKNIKDSLFLGR